MLPLHQSRSLWVWEDSNRRHPHPKCGILTNWTTTLLDTIPIILQIGRKGLASTSFNLISNIQHPVQSGFSTEDTPIEWISLKIVFVRMKGLEPPRLAAPDPKSGAATITPHPVIVTPPGLEPGTPTLKVLCSTYWATKSIHCGPSETRTRVSSVTSWKDDPYPMRP